MVRVGRHGEGAPGAPRIVHLSTVHHTHDNRVFNKEARALTEAGHDFHLVIGAESDGPDDGIPVVALKRRGRLGRIVAGQAEAWGVLRRLRPDLLQVHDPELIPLALLWGRSHHCRVVHDAHEDLVGQVDTKPYLRGPLKPVARMAARGLVGLADRGADAVVAATETVGRCFPHADVTVVRNYPWLASYDRPHRPVEGRMVYVGDLSRERMLPTMIEVTRRVRRQVPAAHLVLAGRVLPGCQEILDEAIEEGIVEHLGLVAPDQVPTILSQASVGLVLLEPLPNYTRSLPTKLFEYMAAEVAFCASDFPAWQEMFSGYGAGIFVDSQDVEATSQALAELLADPVLCRELGRAGREAVSAGLTFESQARALLDLTERLVGPPARERDRGAGEGPALH